VFDATAKTIAELGKREIILNGKKRRQWQRWPSAISTKPLRN
jgi:hypothetical protein